MRRRDRSLRKRAAATGLAMLLAGSIGYMSGRANTSPPDTGKYETTAAMEKILDEPVYANKYVNDALGTLYGSDAISSETYTKMFRIIRDEAEERPELMMHFGPEARDYLLERTLENESSRTPGDMKSYDGGPLDRMRDVLGETIRRLYGD